MDNSKQLARIVMREKVSDKEKAKVLGWIRPPRGEGSGSKQADSGQTACSGTSSFWTTIQRHAIGSQMRQASGDHGGKVLTLLALLLKKVQILTLEGSSWLWSGCLISKIEPVRRRRYSIYLLY
jgi:hypothetical protein